MNSTERVTAALGLSSSATTKFDKALDVDNGGVLLALPALLANGLLDSLNVFDFKSGYYRIEDIFLVIAFMALARVKNINRLSEVSPGEWGRLLGLDRIPEMKTLRDKVDFLSHDSNERILDEWKAGRSKDWMTTAEGVIGHFFVDGHVRTYFGNIANLPYRYVPRQKLCLRGMTDYWVNDQTGKPFLCITTPFSKGLISMLKEKIIPELLKTVPHQPSEEELEKDKRLCRFTVIFDREGFSLKLFKELWDEHRIACQTYNKYSKDDWPGTEFNTITLDTPFETTKEVNMAERGVCRLKDFWIREIRQLTENGHQISIYSTEFHAEAKHILVHMDCRKSQENFFRYGRQEYNIDTLSSYEKTDVDETVNVVNPKYRQLEKDIRSAAGKLGRKHLKRKEMSLKDNPTEKDIKRYEARQGELTKEIEELTEVVKSKKTEKKNTTKHITVKELPEEFQFKMFQGGRKKFIDIIKMIAYRAETAISNIVKPHLSKHDKDTARNLVKNIFQTSADIHPDYREKILAVKLHFQDTHKKDKVIKKLLQFLNETEYYFPGTDLKLSYDFVSGKNP